MSIFSIGVNHQTAPLAFREQVAQAVQNLMETNRSFTEQHSLSEIVTISTCNRVEFYCVCPKGTDQEIVFDWLNQHGVRPERKYFYWYNGQAVVQHLFRVVSSLDSMILGENQIMKLLFSFMLKIFCEILISFCFLLLERHSPWCLLLKRY